MGKYVNSTSKRRLLSSFENKCSGLLEDGAIEINTPTNFSNDLVCVVDNGYFAAAGYCYSESEFNAFNNKKDHRPKRWFIWKKVEEFAE